MPTVLVVDDEPNIRRMLCQLLEAEGYRTVQAADADGALRAAEAEGPDVVLLDLVLPGAAGLDLLERLRSVAPRVPVVMMSGRASLSDAVRATKLGAFHFLEKPLAP
jgi:two-component system, NtrC family, nitrogen regulation response regulator NtrX